MENKEIKIKYFDDEYEISIPSNIDDLKNKFHEKFDINTKYNYDFKIKLKDNPDEIKLNDANKTIFEEYMNLLKKEENPIIKVIKNEVFTSSNFFKEEEKMRDLLDDEKPEIKKEKSNKKDNVEIDEDDDKNTFKENKDFIKELLNCEKNINLLLSGEDIDNNYSKQKTVDFDSKISFDNKYADEMSQISSIQIDKIIQLEEKFETLKKSIKDNKDQIEKKFKEMEQIYEKEKYIQEMKNKHEEELMNEKNKYNELKSKYEEEKNNNKKEMQAIIDKLQNENAMLKKKIERYETDNKKIMEILKNQNK